MPLAIVDIPAHPQNPFGRAFHMDKPTFRCIGEHGHEAMAAVEGDSIQPLRRNSRRRFAGEGKERSFHRVALHRPDPVAVMKSRVVAEGCGACER